MRCRAPPSWHDIESTTSAGGSGRGGEGDENDKYGTGPVLLLAMGYTVRERDAVRKNSKMLVALELMVTKKQHGVAGCWIGSGRRRVEVWVPTAVLFYWYHVVYSDGCGGTDGMSSSFIRFSINLV